MRECIGQRRADQLPIHMDDWTIGFGGTTFRVPVLPEIPRTWNAARLWGWSAQRSLRMFYEWYLLARPGGVFFDVGANDGLHTFPFAQHGYVTRAASVISLSPTQRGTAVSRRPTRRRLRQRAGRQRAE
jgi:hypothetical protein